MENRDCLFSGKSEAYKILEKDNCYKKINPDDIPGLIDNTWRIGVEAAREFIAEYPPNQPWDFELILRQKGMKINYEDRDYVSGGIRYLVDYQTKSKVVNVYIRSVKIWAEGNGYDYVLALNYVLMHEYFHYLEHTKLGYISKTYRVHMIKIFGQKIGATGVPALSEIAANAFAQTILAYVLENSGAEKGALDHESV